MSIIIAFVLGFLLRGVMNNNNHTTATVVHVTPATWKAPPPPGMQKR